MTQESGGEQGGPAGAGGSPPPPVPPPPPPAPPPPPPPFRLLPWLAGKVFSLPGAVVVLAAGIGTVMGTWHDYLKPIFIGPQPSVTFTLIHPRKIEIRISNSGGAPARLELPTFQLFSDGRWGPLHVDDFVDEDQVRLRQHNPVAAPDHPDTQSYQSIREDFFLPQAGCRIRVEIPYPDGGTEPLHDEEPCAH